ncbi:LysM peptidoglycan-binding domain-containing protein [Paenibacillus sp. MMS20-IR301]|uniref:cell division suppressor protein YneA n=1 Tax=Paenibacillus sp. MMS20-IR301 TaxID=2895946 RepID=UPI0028EDF80F|nr:LysM peptidoglycan-binding domain-containing protein [Paenibacillus sp. MMS20-IR301]WNS44979.1 LysM peptidoglycan-binding domain-containing protein [Paenibacillus sp. MMS20-IR301]
MLKYSTYNSIYNEDIKVSAPGNPSIYNQVSQLRDRMLKQLTGLALLFRRISFIKIALVLMLVVSGFTVVGNVFAGSVSSLNQEKRVVVERGDTLWSIALENKPDDMKTAVYIEGIMKNNGLENSRIKAGDILTVPVY